MDDSQEAATGEAKGREIDRWISSKLLHTSWIKEPHGDDYDYDYEPTAATRIDHELCGRAPQSNWYVQTEPAPVLERRNVGR